MSFFDDAVITAKNVTSTVGEKTGKIIDISRLRLSAAEIGKEITRRYEALGRAVYDAKRADNDISGLVSECVRSIDALYARLDEVNAKIAKLKDKKYCEKCGAVLEKTALYCSRCGSRVESKKGSVFVNEKQPEKKEEACEKAESFAAEVSETVENAAENAADTVADIANDICEKAEELADDIKDIAEDISEDDIAASIIDLDE